MRLLDMGIDPFSFSDSLLGVLAQRLARRLCVKCRVKHPALPVEIEALAEEYCYDTDLEARGRARRLAASASARRPIRTKRKAATRAARPATAAASGSSSCSTVDAGNARDDAAPRVGGASFARTRCANGMRTLKQDGIEKVPDRRHRPARGARRRLLRRRSPAAQRLPSPRPVPFRLVYMGCTRSAAQGATGTARSRGSIHGSTSGGE